MIRIVSLFVLCLCCANITNAQYMLKTKKEKEEVVKSQEQVLLDSLFPPMKIGEVPVGTTFLFKESSIDEGEIKMPSWLFDAELKQKKHFDKEWFNGKEVTLTKIYLKKTRYDNDKVVYWDMSCGGETFMFNIGRSFKDLDTYEATKIDMILKQDIETFHKELSGKKVYTNGPYGEWSYIGKLGYVPKFIPITLDSCYVGCGNEATRITAYTEDGERIVLDCSLRLFDEYESLFKSYSFANFILLEDPRPKYPHISDYTWGLIQERKTERGMTAEECILSQGEPTSIGAGGRYYYSNSIIIINNGKVSHISIRSY